MKRKRNPEEKSKTPVSEASPSPNPDQTQNQLSEKKQRIPTTSLPTWYKLFSFGVHPPSDLLCSAFSAFSALELQLLSTLLSTWRGLLGMMLSWHPSCLMGMLPRPCPGPPPCSALGALKGHTFGCGHVRCLRRMVLLSLCVSLCVSIRGTFDLVLS